MYIRGPPRGGAGVLFNYIISEAPVEFLGGFWLGFREFRLPEAEFVFGGFEDFAIFLEPDLPDSLIEFLDLVFEPRGAGAESDLPVQMGGLKSLRARARELPIIHLGSELEEPLLGFLAHLAGCLDRLGLLARTVQLCPK